MIRKIKKRFILLSMLPLLLVMIIIVTAMNVVNYVAFLDESDRMLENIVRDADRPPSDKNKIDSLGKGELPPSNSSHGIMREMRYFTVDLSPDGAVSRVNTSKITSVDEESAKDYALSATGDRGFIEAFRYIRYVNKDGVRIAFLDCGYQLSSIRTFAFSSIFVSLLAYLLVFAVIVVLADRIIRPFAESYEKQKRFITDAGHEIKTPLTIISANVDLMEMEYGNSEYVGEIKQQVANMKELTTSLVYLAKMEESERNMPMIELAFSEIAEETVASFTAPAQLSGVEIRCDIAPVLSVRGEDKSLRELISILLDNAVKYAKRESVIYVRAHRQGRYAILTVENETNEELDGAKLSLMFERFWRNDNSRNSESGGHGIGLSMARAIAEKHGGKISASAKDKSITITVSLPIN